MQQKGFLPLKTGEILSTDGETIVGMKDGVEYVLRFGSPTTVAADAKSSEAKDAGGAEAGEESSGETSGRYLLVMARFNESLLEKPAARSAAGSTCRGRRCRHEGRRRARW